MSDLVPLLSSSTDDFELALLRSTKGDERGAEGLLRTAAALGLGASVMLPALGASPLAATALRVPVWHVVLKWLGFGLLGGVALSGTAVMIGSSSPQPQAPSPTSAVRLASPASKAAAVAVELVSKPEPAVPLSAPSITAENRSFPSEPVAVEHSRLPTAASSVAAFAPLVEVNSPENASSLAAQVRAIEAARQALGANRPSDALRVIENYCARWPSGALTPEATVLGVRAKKMLGDASGAERDGRAFIALYPNSRYAAQLRALLGVTQRE